MKAKFSIFILCLTLTLHTHGEEKTKTDSTQEQLILADIKTQKNKDEPVDVKAQEGGYGWNNTELTDQSKEYLRSKGFTDDEISTLQSSGVTDNMLSQAEKSANIAANLNGAPKLEKAFGTYYQNLLDDYATSSGESLNQKAINLPVELGEKIPGVIFTAKNKSDIDNSTRAFTVMNAGNNEIFMKKGDGSVVSMPSKFYLPTKNPGVVVKAWLPK